jgi:outer membrane protein TolC
MAGGPNFYRFLCFLCGIVLLCVTPRNGSAEPSVPLSLTEAIHTAVDKNPEMTAAKSQVEAAENRIRQVQAGFYPQLSFSETFQQTTNPVGAFGTKLNQAVITQQDFAPDRLNDPNAIQNFITAFNLEWPIYSGGQTRIGLAQARENRQGSDLMLNRTRQNVVAKTARAYVGLLLAHKHDAVIRQVLETARANLAMVDSRFRGGFVVKSDLLRAQVRIAELEQELLTAESRIDIAEALLGAAMGTSERLHYRPVDSLEQFRQMEGDRQHWIEKALSQRPELEQVRLQEAIAEKEIAKARAAHLPNLNLFGSYEINSEDFSDTADNYSVGAIFRLNLYSGHRISAQTAEARAAHRQIGAVVKNMELGVQVETEQAFLEANSAWQRIGVAEKAVDQAQEGLRIVKNRYNTGLLTIVGLLDAEVALQQARMRHFQALHDYKVSRIQLALAAGVLDTDFQ